MCLELLGTFAFAPWRVSEVGFQLSFPAPGGENLDPTREIYYPDFPTGPGTPKDSCLTFLFPFQEAIQHKSFFESERKLECGNVDEAFKIADQILEGKSFFNT